MQKEIALGTLVLIVSNLLSRVLGLARDALLAHRGGLSMDVDAYNLAFLIPDLLNHFLGAGLLPVTLIPLIMPLLKEGRYDLASQQVSRLLNVLGVLVILGCVLAFWKMDWLLPLICEKQLAPELIEKTVHYSRILLFAQVFFVAGGFFNAMQYGRMKFILPALAPLAYNGMIILMGWLSPGGTVEGFCWGVLIGAFIGSFVFQWIGAYQAGFKWTWIWEPFKPEVGRFLWKTLPFLVGASAVFANEFVYRRFGAEDVGSIASLGFGLRMSMAISGVLGGAVGIAVYPWFSRLCAENKKRELSFELGKLLEKVFVILLPVLALIYGSAELIIRLYLGSGHFGLAEIQRQVPFLQAYLWQVVPMTILILVNRAFYADQRTWFPSVISVSLFLASWPLYTLFREFGALRVPWISTATTTLTMLSLLLVWLKQSPGMDLWKFARTFVIATVIGMGLWWEFSALLHLPFFATGKSPIMLGSFVFISAASVLGAWLMMAYLGIDAAEQWKNSLSSKLKKIIATR